MSLNHVIVNVILTGSTLTSIPHPSPLQLDCPTLQWSPMTSTSTADIYPSQQNDEFLSQPKISSGSYHDHNETRSGISGLQASSQTLQLLKQTSGEFYEEFHSASDIKSETSKNSAREVVRQSETHGGGLVTEEERFSANGSCSRFKESVMRAGGKDKAEITEQLNSKLLNTFRLKQSKETDDAYLPLSPSTSHSTPDQSPASPTSPHLCEQTLLSANSPLTKSPTNCHSNRHTIIAKHY